MTIKISTTELNALREATAIAQAAIDARREEITPQQRQADRGLYGEIEKIRKTLGG